MVKPGLGFRAGFLEEVMPELKLAGVGRVGGKWQGGGKGACQCRLGRLAWAGNARRAVCWGGRWEVQAHLVEVSMPVRIWASVPGLQGAPERPRAGEEASELSSRTFLLAAVQGAGGGGGHSRPPGE